MKILRDTLIEQSILQSCENILHELNEHKANYSTTLSRAILLQEFIFYLIK